MNVATLLSRAGRTFGERPAVACGAQVHVHYRALAERTARLAGALAGRFGLAPGDRVALFMRNLPEYVELLFAAWHAGLVAVPVNAKLHPKEVDYVLEHSGARVCFVSDDLVALVLPRPGVIVVAVGSTDWRRLDAEPAAMAERAPDDPAWLFYTSGTTGRPKGATLSHRNLLAMTTSYFADVDIIGPMDSILHAAPMSHGSGLYILPHVAAAACQVVPESGHFEPAELWAMLRHHDGATIFAAPTMVRRLVDDPGLAGADLSHLKTIVYGGGPMYLADCRRALDALGHDKLAQIYGQGETPMTITALSKHHHMDRGHPRHEQRLASVGVAHTVVEVRVVDPEDRPLPPGEAGEVVVRGDTVTAGYWRDPEASAEALRGGWLHTGDVGAFDADGFLTLMDRSKDLIVSGGSNIYPREVEEVLLRHPAVAEVAVVGAPDPEWGEVAVAFVVPRPDVQLDAAELDRLCLESIARFKRPKRYRLVPALPKNAYGKVLKRELRAIA